MLLVVLGLNRFKKNDRLNLDKYTYGFLENHRGLTEDYWPLYAVAAGVGTFLGWTWLLLLGCQANHMMKVSVHILTTYLAVISVFCFWAKQFFWGVAFAIGAMLQFLYVISVIDRYCKCQTPLILMLFVKEHHPALLTLYFILWRHLYIEHFFSCIFLKWLFSYIKIPLTFVTLLQNLSGLTCYFLCNVIKLNLHF